MKASARSLRFLGEGKEISVPFFQRRYVWDEENWNELLNSFENTQVVPFLGSIILREESGSKFTIIDGQQRLTTVTILAKAIYDCLPDSYKMPNSGIRRHIESYLFYLTNAADNFEDGHIKINHSKNDNADYSRVIWSQMKEGCKKIDLDTINEKSSNILKCYKYYCEKLIAKHEKYLTDLFNSIFDESRRVFVLIELELGDINEQTIFDTINRAGVRLSAADIIKNNLYKHLILSCGADEERKEKVLNAYDECWEKIFNKDQKTSNLWDEERVFGNVKHSNLEFLLYCIACIKWGEDCDMFSKLATVFEREVSHMGYVELMSLAREIKEYAIIFKKYILDFKTELEDEKYFKYDQYVDRLLLVLQVFKIQMFYPYVLMRIHDVNEDFSDEKIISDFNKLESFVMRRKISPRGTHDYTSKCYSIIKEGIDALVLSDLNNPESQISDSDIKEYLFETKDDAAKMILFCIELFRRKAAIIDVKALEYRYTLEHVMPKKWPQNWSDVEIINEGTILDVASEEGIRFRDRAVQSLGNKTLLTGSLNSSIKNGTFSKKINGDGEQKPGYKKHTMLLITREIVDEYTEWDEKNIKERTEKLYEEFLQIWPSFANSDLNNHIKERDTQVKNYTEEEINDPIKLYEAMKRNENNDGVL